MISGHELLARVRIDQQRLQSWIDEGWLVPHRGDEPLFSEMDIARAQFIRELKEDFEVNDEGIGLILHLVDQVHGLRRQMQALMHKFSANQTRDGNVT
jgi:chaperone modulatory protein CbpM